MMTNRARGVWAALLALMLAAQIPATVVAGDAGKAFMPDPQPMPATGDPDAPTGGSPSRAVNRGPQVPILLVTLSGLPSGRTLVLQFSWLRSLSMVSMAWVDGRGASR